MEQNQDFRELILRHNNFPISYGEPDHFDAKIVANNPLCGDHYELYIQHKDGKVKSISFTGEGCAISKASTSMLVETIGEIDAVDFQELYQKFTAQFKRNGPAHPSDLAALQGVKNMPARINCAVLSWNALMQFLLKEKNDGLS